MKYIWQWPVLALALSGPLMETAPARTPNSLWIGTDNTSTRNVLNTDRSGNVLQTVGPVEATGFAVDVAGNKIYFGDSGGAITPRNLTTLTPGASFFPGTVFGEDMTFDGSEIWRADISGVRVVRINPSSGAIDASFSTSFFPLGVAWDGSGLWVSEFARGGRVEKFTISGMDTGIGFNVDSSIEAGGLAFDSTDNTLWLGTFGNVYHYSLSGSVLGSFAVPSNQDPSRFIDGLEFEGSPAATPDQGSTAALLFGGCLGLLVLRGLTLKASVTDAGLSRA